MGQPVLDLDEPRRGHEIFSATLTLYFRRPGLFLALALVVVVPADLLLYGVARGELWGYRHGEPLGFVLAAGVVNNLWLMPLLTAVHVRAVQRLGMGEEPRAQDVLKQEAREVWPVALALILMGLGVLLGFVALILPGVYLITAWTFAAQSVVIDGMRGRGALRASSALVKGRWWRTFWLGWVVYGIGDGLGVGIHAALSPAVRSAHSGVLQVATTTLAGVVGLSFTALVTAVWYFAWRARGEPQRAPVDPHDPTDLRG